MAGNNVKNFFEQTGTNENTLVLGSTVKGADGLQAPLILDPVAGAVIDAEARIAIIDILNALRNVGIVAV